MSPTSSGVITLLTANTERMRISSDGNVGIGGIADSNSKLHVFDSTASVDDYTIHIESYTPALIFQDISGGPAIDFGIQVDGSAMMFRYGDASSGSQLASEAMRIDSSGNVGIGVTPQTDWTSTITALQIGPQSVFRAGATEYTDATVMGTNVKQISGTNKYIETGAATEYYQQSGIHFWNYAASGTAGNTISFSEAMRIDSSGNVGIGQSLPLAMVDIKGDTTTYGGMAKIYLTDSNANSNSRNWSIGNGGSGFGNLTFAVSAAKDGVAGDGTAVNAMVIDSSGNVGIGTDSPSQSIDTTGKVRIRDGGNTTIPSLQMGSTGVDGFALPATNTLGLITNSSEAMRIDSSGNLLVGKTSADDGAAAGIEAQAGGSVYLAKNAANLHLNRLSTDGDIAVFRKDGTTVGSISSRSGIHIQIQSAGDTAGLHFGGAEINPVKNQSISDNTIDLGQASYRFDDIYATNGTIQTSDRNEKQDIAELSDAEQRVAVAAKGLLRKFRWKDAVAEKGDEARTHFGIIAQDLQAAFAAEGLDAGDYAMFISSTWTDEETGEERTRMGVRYSELLAFIIAAI
jgi:hypothetical protein